MNTENLEKANQLLKEIDRFKNILKDWENACSISYTIKDKSGNELRRSNAEFNYYWKTLREERIIEIKRNISKLEHQFKIL